MTSEDRCQLRLANVVAQNATAIVRARDLLADGAKAAPCSKVAEAHGLLCQAAVEIERWLRDAGHLVGVQFPPQVREDAEMR